MRTAFKPAAAPALPPVELNTIAQAVAPQNS